MSQPIPRWTMETKRGIHVPADDGTCVSYADHIAAMAELKAAHETALRDELQTHLDAVDLVRAEVRARSCEPGGPVLRGVPFVIGGDPA